jgi:hypothetical protein
MITFLYAFAGGLCINLIRLFELTRSDERAATRLIVRDPIYWVQFFLTPLVGGLLAIAYGVETKLPPLLAFHIGVSTPMLIKTVLTTPLSTAARASKERVD